VANPELKLKPGMTANVTFVYADKTDVLRVPNVALRFRPPADALPSSSARPVGSAEEPRMRRPGGGGGRGEGASDQRAVWVLRGGVPVRRSVKVGVTDGSYTEIVEGELQAGEAVITATTADAGQAKPGTQTPGGNNPMRRMF
jgi:HlyD family secretion protein